MRSTKELLQLMLQHKCLFKDGLCNWNYYLYHYGLISYFEYKELKKYIKENKPSIFSSFSTFSQRLSGSCYYWEKGVIEYRINWIKKHIKLNK